MRASTHRAESSLSPTHFVPSYGNASFQPHTMTGITLGGAPAEAPNAALLARGVCRALEQLGYASLLEFPLANGRRADILALGRGGDLAIIEIKSSVADFRADRKWVQYRDFADRFYFAVPSHFPVALIPEDCGLIVADAFSASLIRDGGATILAPGRRRAVTLRFALAAAARLRRHLDPQAGLAPGATIGL
ncbi:MAG TPA: MmcB family DNA repair protein [Stellaceae bacterium]|nr:MmcB family DNA repair protein [Stellaceae bacterium]